MSIRPSYGRRSVLQVLSDGMSQRPPTGKSCCEDAALNAAEVDRLTRERDELQDKLDAAEWLGDVPDKPEVKLGAQTATVGGNIYNVYNHTAKGLRAGAWELLALADAIEAEEDERDDEEARIEDQAERLYLSTQDELCVAWESLTEPMQNGFRASIRAGWTKEDQ